jgi:predicted nucleic acid-binding protein
LKIAFVDTSLIVAMVLGEPDSIAIANQLNSFARVSASNLLEAELRSVCHREQRTFDDSLLKDVQWIEPDRALTDEITRVLAAGYVRGADCWHLATALFVAGDPNGFTFLTRDVRQREVAHALGFDT